MQKVCEYEVNYINATRYCLAFQDATLALRGEALLDKDEKKAPKLNDTWVAIAVRYALRN